MLAIAALALVACASPPPAARPAADSSASRSVPTLATSLAGADGTGWAVVEMGDSASAENNFWELFARPAGGTEWKLATPAGVASNGGLIMTQGGGGTVVTGFRPSQHLTFSPLAATADTGSVWLQRPPLVPGLANVPGALAGNPAGRLLALTSGGDVDAGAGLSTSWTRLTSLRALADSRAGRECGLTALTAVAWTPAGTPLVAGDCTKPGAAGIFSLASGTWQPAGPALSGGADGAGADVLGLATTDGSTTAIMAVGRGAASAVIAAWSADGGAHWTLSAQLHAPALAAGAEPSVSFLGGGSVGLVLTAHGGRAAASRAYTIGWHAGQWRTLPPLPGRAGPGQLATLAATAGTTQALVVHRGTLSVWQLGTSQWTLAQTVRVTIPYGSSG